jgi:hypothetical protein
VRVKIHDRTSVYVREERNLWWSSGDSILRIGIAYEVELRSGGGGSDGVFGAGSDAELVVDDFLRSRGIKGGIALDCLVMSTA